MISLFQCASKTGENARASLQKKAKEKAPLQILGVYKRHNDLVSVQIQYDESDISSYTYVQTS